jgi:hypothetical protein
LKMRTNVLTTPLAQSVQLALKLGPLVTFARDRK